MKYSLDWLKQNQEVKYLYFWGHQPSKDGSITATCFSQWWVAPFQVDGKVYPTAEHWMMEKKALLFGDIEMANKILETSKPGDAKMLGRKVKNFDDQTWNKNRSQIVVDGNIHKFSQHSDLKKFLLNTNDRIIVEASPVDFIWGIGLKKEDPRAANPETWRGLNLLGFALMEVRDKLKSDFAENL